ncbi:SRPBCC domain-containing protein [Parafrigoribacterium humi]|jgi:activator of HSP90 ATPase|uniref:SRPBCC domain-containing protein n=1 Tax=Parafrigoribacterium humi TaxID=3144664 RepID=UPI0032EE88D9
MANTAGNTGRTKDAGWEVGVRQTVPAALSAVWEFLLGDGLPLWLGETTLVREKGEAYETADGVVGTVRSYAEGSKIRLGWHPSDWPHETVLQLTVKESATGTTIGIHHEKLADRDERRMMLGHWKSVIAELADAVNRL